MRTIKPAAYHCEKCGRTWLPRKASRPVSCPNPHCRSTRWWEPKAARPGDMAQTTAVG